MSDIIELFKQRAKDKDCGACGSHPPSFEIQPYEWKDGINGFICRRCAGNSWKELRG